MATEHVTLKADYEIIEDFSNCTFESNGGAIYAAVGKTLTSDGQEHTFSANSAANGGAIAARNATITLSNLNFTENTATTNGGAIYLYTDAKGTLTDCVFEGNSAKKGGAIYVASGALTIDGCDFLTASDSIYVASSNAKLNLEGIIELAASIDGGDSALATLNGATIDFQNEEEINVVKLINGTAANGDGVNTLVFNYDSAMVNFLATQDQGRKRQNLKGFNLVYVRENDDDTLKVQVATGVELVDTNSMEHSEDNTKVGFFSVDKSKNLMYVWTDTLYVMNTSNKDYVFDVDTFETLEKLYASAGNEFAGNIYTTVDEGTTLGTAKKTKSVRGAYNKVESATIKVNGTVTGSVMGFYADDNTVIMSDEPLEGNITSTQVMVGESGRVDKYVIGGAYTKNGMVAILDSYVALSGTVNGHTFGGSFVYGAGAGVVELSTVEIDGATIADGKYVLGGGMASGEGVSYVTATEVDVWSDTDAQVFGGGWGQQGSIAEVETAEIWLSEGTVDTVFAGGTNDATGKSDVTDSSTIYLAGGTANTIHLNGKNSASTMTGKATLVVQMDAQVEWIEGLTASGFGGTTETTLDVGAKLTVGKIAHVDNWIISNDCSIDYTGILNFRQLYVNSNDPEGVQQFGNKIALDITGTYTDDWTVVSAASKIANFNDDYLEVTLFGQDTEYADGAFTSSDYALFLSEDKKSIQLAQLV